jgi:phosphoribosylformylglycinamidine cyclo-ligase
MAHITGGGIAGNLVRVLPADCVAEIDPTTWEWPAIFTAIATGGAISRQEMRDVFNLGLGMIAVVPPEATARVQAAATAAGVVTWDCGMVRRGTRAVNFSDG